MSRMNTYEEVVAKARKVVLEGGVILFPTDTIWGLGCDARNSVAVRKVLSIKRRTTEKGFILIEHSYQELQRQHPTICDQDFLKRAEEENHPFTFVYPSYEGCCEEVKANDDTVAIRVVKDEFCRMLIQAVGFPLVATSANLSGEPFPHRLEEVSEHILREVDWIAPAYLDIKTSHKTPSPSYIYTHKDGSKQWIRLR